MGAIDVTNFNVHIKDSDNGSTNLPVAVQVEAANQAPVDIVLDGDPVREDWGRGTVAGILEAQDPNGETDFEFALASASEQRFEIVQRNGQWVLVLKQALDYDNATSDTPNGPRYHTVEIKVTDGGDLSYTETVKVYVTDDGIVPENAVPEIKVIGEPVTTAQDDTIPTVFAHLAVNDVEDSQSTTDKMTLKITFARGHGALEGRTPDDFSETDTHVTYTYTDLMVNLNQLLRQLKFNPDDYENAPSGWTRDTHFQVTIIDSEGGSTSTDVDVEVTANRQPEQIVFDGDEVSESEGQNTRVGTLQATDPNGDTLTFSTADDDPFFDTVFEDGVWKLILKQRLEYDTATIDWVNDPTGMTRYYEAYVTVSDGGPNGSREEVILVYVTESDNEPPTITPNGDGLGQIEDIAEGKVFAHLTLGDTEDEISDEDMTLEITFELGRGDLVGIDPVLKTSSATHVTYVYKGSLAFLNNLLLNVLKFAPDDRPTEKGEVETTNFSVMIIDSDNGTAQVDVVLDVVAANQGPKDFTLTGFRADGAVEVEENQYGGETVLFQIGELEAVDPNGDELIYVFSSDADSNPHGFFRIDDDRLVLASGVFLDYDANDPLLKGVLGGERWYEVKIKVTDGEEEVEKTFQVFVKDDPTDQPNVAPKLEIQGTKEWPPIKDIETIQPFAGVTIEDSATQILTITITLSGNTGEFTDDSIPDNLQLSYENGVLRLRGSAVDLTNALQNLVFDPKDRANAEVGEEETTTFTITVTDGNLTTSNSEIKVVAEAANRAPTAITLSGNGIQENCVIGEVVGILGAADTNDGDTFTYELETDAGGRFKIVQQGNDWVIVTLKGIDFDNDSDLQSGDVNGVPRKWFNVDVRVTDQGGTGDSIVRPVQIFVNDEAPDTQYDPTGATLSDHSIMENVDPGTAVGTLDGIDRNGGDTFTFAVVDNSATDPLSAHTLFDVSADGKLITKGEIDWDAVDGLLQVETDASGNITRKYYVVYVEVRDQANTATPAYVQRFEIDVEEDPNEGGNTAPENIRLSEQFVAENLSVGAAVGSILADDANGDTLTFELIENGGGAFDLIGDTIFVKDHTKLDYEQYATGEISLTVGVSDGTETVTHVINLGLEKFSRESVTGNADANLMRGGGGNDEFRGGLGNDTLSGGSGQDALVGGGGSDVFLFDSPLARTNIDLIADFNRSDGDQIRLAKTIFANLSGTGVLQEDEFVVDTEARTANHHIIYDRQSGKLYYDLDGVGGRAAIQFASFRVTQTVPAPEVKFSDFFIL
jgi:Ca2+-binding RTX toxin-like protein